MKKNGFTLIELLVVIMVLSTVGAIVVAIIVSTLRGSQKTATLTEVRQNGNFAISTIGRMVRNSQRITLCANNKISIINPDQGTTEFSCSLETISSNSASLFPSSVSVSPCSISCTNLSTGSAQMVLILFTVQSVTDKTTSIPFQTSIQTRNY